MNRRSFLQSVSAGILCAPGESRGATIEPGEIQTDLTALSLYGRPQGGNFASGVSRIGYSDADIAGRKFIIERMAKAGARVRIDAAGNIFAERPGRDPSAPPVLFGSHIDSVPSGGNFDGDLGSLAAIRILQLVNDGRLETRHPLTAVVWACEEASFAGGALNGSRAAAGKLFPGELAIESRGMVKADAIRRIGGDPAKLETALIRPGDYHAYVEMHIEQGGTLERDRVPVGVVDGIVAIDDYDVVVSGMANHAGTTPMPDRRDALVAASALTIAVREIVTAEAGAQVGTVGRLEVSPNAVNVVPGEVRMSIEFRDLSTATLDRLGEKIRGRAAQISRQTGTDISLTRKVRLEPAIASPEVQRAIESAAGKRRLLTRHLPSGAGHDAQSVARLMPMGMIFVPSVGGISHSPKELTSWQDCANGANILLDTVLALAS